MESETLLDKLMAQLLRTSDDDNNGETVTVVAAGYSEMTGEGDIGGDLMSQLSQSKPRVGCGCKHGSKSRLGLMSPFGKPVSTEELTPQPTPKLLTGPKSPAVVSSYGYSPRYTTSQKSPVPSQIPLTGSVSPVSGRSYSTTVNQGYPSLPPVGSLTLAQLTSPSY